MENEEILQLITELRRKLVDNGFGWVVDEAEAELYATVELRTRALALIDAAESVTVNIADVELRTLDVLDVENVDFQRDEVDPTEGDVGMEQPFAVEIISGTDGLRGAQRREALELLAEQRLAFTSLRRRLDGDE